MPKPPRAWRAVQRDELCKRTATLRLRSIVRRKVLAPPESAKAAGLRYVNDERTPGIRRLGRNNRFRYVDPAGRTITNSAERQRIRSLVIPPAWTSVWICTDPRGHLQATGRDARGREQYRYHPRWREVRDKRIARIVKACRDFPGYELFQYVDDDGDRQVVDSADVNAYVREVSGQDFTAKDFRTWAGTVLAARALAELGPAPSQVETKRNIVRAIEQVAKRPGTTPAGSRK